MSNLDTTLFYYIYKSAVSRLFYRYDLDNKRF